MFFNACNYKTDVVTEQGDNNWIVLNVEDAKTIDGNFLLDFQLNTVGKYDIQILSKGKLSSPLPEITVETGGVVLNEAPKLIFVLGDEGQKQTISQFRRSIIFSETGKHTLKIEADIPFEQVRIVPTYQGHLGFGSGEFFEKWQKMHNSPEKQAALAALKEAKYGMFIHWGLYSQAGGIWKGKHIEDSPYPGPRVAEWLMYTFRIPRAEYEQLAKTFNPDKSFAENIARLAKDAGMKYVVITSKHHDGFALFDSECSEYDMVEATPYKADAITELYNACLNEGLIFGVYYSHGNDWHDGTDGNYAKLRKQNDSLGILSRKQGKNFWDPSPNTFKEYLENKAYPQIEELLELMPGLSLIWFDGEGNITEEQAFKFYKLVYDINPNVVVNRRVGYNFGDYLDAGDNVIPSANDKLAKHWETCGTTNNTWGFKLYDTDWKSTRELLYYLIDIASKGGNYLLNIGPDGLGNVPEQSAFELREIGEWLAVNGDAIYGTTRWKIPNEGQDETLLEGTRHRAKKGFSRSFSSNDFWFTTKENKVYAISLVQPKAEVKIKSLQKANGTIKSVSLLGSSSELKWEQADNALNVDLSDVETNSNGYVLEVTFK